jgi:hypothetical protein
VSGWLRSEEIFMKCETIPVGGMTALLEIVKLYMVFLTKY